MTVELLEELLMEVAPEQVVVPLLVVREGSVHLLVVVQTYFSDVYGVVVGLQVEQFAQFLLLLLRLAAFVYVAEVEAHGVLNAFVELFLLGHHFLVLPLLLLLLLLV